MDVKIATAHPEQATKPKLLKASYHDTNQEGNIIELKYFQAKGQSNCKSYISQLATKP